MSAGDIGQDLPKDEWLEFFKELNRCYVMNVTLEGGEPFYREDLCDLIEGIVRNRMRFNILSNGTLITKEMAGFLSSAGRCDGVQISIDGSHPAAHDTFRGKETFKKALNGIMALRENNVPVFVRVTVHKKNITDLEGIAVLLLDELKLPGFSTNSASYLGTCRQNSAQVQLSVEERSSAMKKLLELNRRYNGRITATAGPLADAKTWLKMERARLEKRAPFNGAGVLRGCGGPNIKLAVRADGAIVPCSLMSHIRLGMINKDDLKKLWQDHPELNKLRERKTIPLREFEFCNGCEYVDYCTGNCPALAFTMLGDEYHPSPDSCLRRFLEAGGRIPVNDMGDTHG